MARTTLRIAWQSPNYIDALARVMRFARGSQSLLISGESGVGKTAFAEVVHFVGSRAGHPFLAVNCAALPDSLLESELFGHVRGAFTGAHVDKVGLIRAAERGTVFLDEIDKASPAAQAALLHVLDRHEVRAVGGAATRRVHARFVFATSRCVTTLAQRGEFLPDLAFRIRGLGAVVPPLRDRAEDFDLLLAVALRELRREEGWSCRVSHEARDFLSTYDWPGNVRELFRTVQAGAHLADEGQPIGLREIELAARASRLETHADRVRCETALTSRVQEFERQEILLALRLEGGNQSGAARRLGLSRRGLNKKLHRYELLDQLEREGLRAFRCRRAQPAAAPSSP